MHHPRPHRRPPAVAQAMARVARHIRRRSRDQQLPTWIATRAVRVVLASLIED